MDETEAENDVKLYKASNDLVIELQTKLPLLLWHPRQPSISSPKTTNQSSLKLRKRILFSKCTELAALLDRFQEWPQLLDPHLGGLVHLLADACLGYLTTPKYRDDFRVYHRQRLTGISLPAESASIPLLSGCCRLLYTLCKVRGYKVIVQLLNNEPRYIDPILSCLCSWSHGDNASDSGRMRHAGSVWEERYILLLWLSHLMLAPFELTSLSTRVSAAKDQSLDALVEDMPPLAVDTITTGLRYVTAPSKERESASILLGRLALRRDMQARDLPRRLTMYCLDKINREHSDQSVTVYDHLGHLTVLYGILNIGSGTETSSFITTVFQSILRLATEDKSSVKDSAPARKLFLKIMRCCMVHALSLSSKHSTVMSNNQAGAMLEDGIQYLLDAVGDKDTPVRMAASKALSMIALKLDISMSTEVVEAVLGSLNENILYQHLQTGQFVAKLSFNQPDASLMKKNLSAVDPLKWHGLMLTLGHLLFRRSPPASLLSDIVEALHLGLDFEQRSNVGTSVGGAVRDAACFGIWSLARKYSTAEIQAVSLSESAVGGKERQLISQNALQFIANRLVISACLDPAGNIRRGASAALQELIGRHPDAILHGISLVQTVDYQAVGRRSHAMIEIAKSAALLDRLYLSCLLEALMGWRGARATDAESRRFAASSIQSLASMAEPDDICQIYAQLNLDICRMKESNIGSNAGLRHGLLLAASAVFAVVAADATKHTSHTSQAFLSTLPDIVLWIGKIDGRVTSDLELVFEAICVVITEYSSILLALMDSQAKSSIPSGLIPQWVRNISAILDRCTVASENLSVATAAANANRTVFELLNITMKQELLDKWLENTRHQPNFRSKGRIFTLSNLFPTFSNEVELNPFRYRIISYLKAIVQDQEKIEMRINAMEGIGILIPALSKADSDLMRSLVGTFVSGLTDYTTDSRGDIGSLLRLQSLDAVKYFRKVCSECTDRDEMMAPIVQEIVKLATERLNKVRFRAWEWLEEYWRVAEGFPPLDRSFVHISDVSSESYYSQLMPLLFVPWLRTSLLHGIISSATTGSDDISRACCTSLISYLNESEGSIRDDLMMAITAETLDYLDTSPVVEDRMIVPGLEFLAFLLDAGFDSARSSQIQSSKREDIWTIVLRVCVPGSSIPRLEAAIRVFTALYKWPAYRIRSLDRLTRMLLHKWPMIRNAAGDALYINTSAAELLHHDFNANPNTVKPAVVQLRKILQISSSA